MASNNAKQERIKELVAALLAAEAAEGRGDAPETMDEIEEGMIRVSDWVAREFGEQKLARHSARPPSHPRCPDCGQEGEVVGEQEREVLTRRGHVTLRAGEVSLPPMSAAFFSLSRAHWGLSRSTITRPACIGGSCSRPRKAAVSPRRRNCCGN